MARPALVAIMAAYNEQDIIGTAVAHLVSQGASVYLLDDGSTDGTVEAARTAAGERLVGCESLSGPEDGQPATFRWSRILQRKAELAASIDADWFIHQDADEFRDSPWPHLSLAEAVTLVGRLGWNAVDFEVFNFPPTRGEFKPGGELATTFTHFHPAEPFDRVQIRCWRKTAVLVDLVSTGGHEARFPERRVFPIRFPMRHYPIRSAAQGERKVFLERKRRFDPEERARGWHVQYDRFVEGRPVQPDPATLLPYDADAAAVALQVKHRLIENACPSVAADFPPDLSAYARSIEGDIARQAEHVRTLTLTLEERRHELAVVRARSDELERWLQNALAHVAALEAREREARAEIDLVNRNARDLASRLDETLASWSWRLTRPLRAAWRLLGGR